MAFKTSIAGIEARPILPPIHTLDLPFLSRTELSNVQYDNYYNSLTVSMYFVRMGSYSKSFFLQQPFSTSSHGRHVFTSSSCTSVSRNTSPSLSDCESDSSSETSDSLTKLRLEPCSLDDADAIILIRPEEQSSNYVSRQGKGRGVLLVGPALQQVRHPQRPLAKGARIHPYRIVRGSRPKTNNSARRSSIVSVTGFCL